jgi:RNA polymerase sigma factor (sigma-70 family)
MHHHAKPYVDGLHAERSARQAAPADGAESERLVLNASRADEEAWTALVTRFDSRIRSVARQHRIGHHDAEDVAQITWLRLLTRMDNVREPAKVGAYLQTIARRESIRRCVTSRREDPLSDDGREAPATDAESLLEGVLARERSEALTAALERLPERQRALMLMLIDDAELSYAEIAEALDIPVGSIGPTRGRTFDRLRTDPGLVAVVSGD